MYWDEPRQCSRAAPEMHSRRVAQFRTVMCFGFSNQRLEKLDARSPIALNDMLSVIEFLIDIISFIWWRILMRAEKK